LNPKSADFGALREPWQAEMAVVDAAHRDAARDLRVIGNV
jgi:hypothetical protein